MPASTAADLETRLAHRLDEVGAPGTPSDFPTDLLRNELAAAAADAIRAAPYDVLIEAAKAATFTAATAALLPRHAKASEEAAEGRRLILAERAARVLAIELDAWLVPVREHQIVSAASQSRDAVRVGDLVPTLDYPAAFEAPATTTDAETGATVVTRALDVYPSPVDDAGAPTAFTATVYYVPEGMPPETLPEALLDAVIWQAAARVAGGFLREPATAELCKAEAEGSLVGRTQRHTGAAARGALVTYRRPTPL